MIRLALPLAIGLLFFSVSPPDAYAQTAVASSATSGSQGLTMERSDLQTLLEELEGVSASSAYSSRIRDRAAGEADQIRTRLELGDFRVGDQIVLRIEGEGEIPERIPVQPGPRITLPVIGPISLDGVLRSELEAYLTRELAQFIRNPVVRAESEIRVAVLGEVGSPGFYTVPAEMLLGEVLMHAGGPSSTADLDEVRIERQGRELWGGEGLRDALAEGRTLDQLNVRAGDQIVVPVESTRNVWGTVARWGAAVGTSVIFGVGFLF